MTYISHNEVPKVIRDTLAEIMAHPQLDEFMIDPNAVIEDMKVFKVDNHPWWQEKYLCLMENPVVYCKNAKKLSLQMVTARNHADLPDTQDTAPKDLRDLVGKLNRYLQWWLGDDDRRDDHYVNMERVAAFNTLYPEYLLMPSTALKKDEPWYSNSEEHEPIIRTPRGLITANTDSIFNNIQFGNTNWDA